MAHVLQRKEEIASNKEHGNYSKVINAQAFEQLFGHMVQHIFQNSIIPIFLWKS